MMMLLFLLLLLLLLCLLLLLLTIMKSKAEEVEVAAENKMPPCYVCYDDVEDVLLFDVSEMISGTRALP